MTNKELGEKVEDLEIRLKGLQEDIMIITKEILSKVVYGKKAHPRLITVKQLVLAVPLHR
jgi:hypothetical protein